MGHINNFYSQFSRECSYYLLRKLRFNIVLQLLIVLYIDYVFMKQNSNLLEIIEISSLSTVKTKGRYRGDPACAASLFYALRN